MFTIIALLGKHFFIHLLYILFLYYIVVHRSVLHIISQRHINDLHHIPRSSIFLLHIRHLI